MFAFEMLVLSGAGWKAGSLFKHAVSHVGIILQLICTCVVVCISARRRDDLTFLVACRWPNDDRQVALVLEDDLSVSK